MKASIRLVSLLAGALLSFSTGCAGATPAGPTVPRLVRERMVLADESPSRAAVSLAVPLEHRPERARVVFVRRVNVPK